MTGFFCTLSLGNCFVVFATVSPCESDTFDITGLSHNEYSSVWKVNVSRNRRSRLHFSGACGFSNGHPFRYGALGSEFGALRALIVAKIPVSEGGYIPCLFVTTVVLMISSWVRNFMEMDWY